LDLTRRGDKLYYKDAQITREDGKGLYALTSIKGKGAAEFKRVVAEGQQRLVEQSQQPKQPTEPNVVNRQPIEHKPIDRTFDNPGYEDKDDDELTQRLTDLKTINANLEAVGEPPLDSYKTPGIPLETLREMEGLTDTLIKTKSGMEAAYVELRKEEGT